MDVPLTNLQNDLIGTIACKEGFSDFDLITKSGTIKGDNYMGVITTVTIKDDEKKLDLILKSALTNEDVRKKAPVGAVYLREIYMYETVFPEFKKFQEEQGLTDGFSAYAKIYGSCDKEPTECLIFENLREKGYKVWNRKVPMNADHVALVLTEYGKFHAISLGMKEKKPELYEKLTKNLKHVFEGVMEGEEGAKMRDIVLETGSKAVKEVPSASEAYQRFAPEVPKLIEDFKVPEEKLVITHGDSWCNNMIFKYAVRIRLCL